MARPKKPVNEDQILTLAKLHCTHEEIAAVTGVSTKTLQRRYVHLIEKGREEGKASLRRMQFKKAMEGNPTMLIWLGKQHLGQADEQRVKVGSLDEMTDDELKALAAGKAPKP